MPRFDSSEMRSLSIRKNRLKKETDPSWQIAPRRRWLRFVFKLQSTEPPWWCVVLSTQTDISRLRPFRLTSGVDGSDDDEFERKRRSCLWALECGNGSCAACEDGLNHLLKDLPASSKLFIDRFRMPSSRWIYMMIYHVVTSVDTLPDRDLPDRKGEHPEWSSESEKSASSTSPSGCCSSIILCISSLSSIWCSSVGSVRFDPGLTGSNTNNHQINHLFQ